MSRTRLLTILITVAVTVLASVVALNFRMADKRIDRKIEHRFAVDGAQFRREMGVMLGPGLLPGNEVVDLENGDSIFPSMLEAIRGASSTINFETYIYWSGTVGQEFADALSERARAGVRVNVLLDWVGSMKIEQSLLQEMRDAGVKVRMYRPLRWYNLGRINNRTHRKLLIVDGRIGFTGGVGIADQWSGHAQDAEHWRDMHFRVMGPVVWQFQAAFNDNWIKTTGEVLNGEDYFPPLATIGEMDAQLFVASPAGGSESMHLMYLMSIAASTQSIDLAASYFVPDELVLKALLAARQRGVRIRILLPGDHIDSDAVRHASRAQWGGLLDAGVQIFEFLPTMMHNKLLIVDREMVSVGSTNFDVRSFRLNDEASMNVYDRDFAARMTEVFEADMAHTRTYTRDNWARRPLRERFLEGVLLPLRSQL